MRDWVSPTDARRLLKIGTGRGIKIAVLDSGIESSHPALRGLRLSDDIVLLDDGFQLTIGHGEGRDVFGHGTAVAGILRQLAPEAQIGSFRVLGERLDSKTQIICAAAREAMERGYQILNCSFGCGVERQVLEYKQWIDEAYLKGVHVVAACNNNDFRQPEWPGYFPSVITVNMANTAQDDQLYYKEGHLVEFAARGVNQNVLWRGGVSKKVSGSSFAAPLVAGLVARLLSERPDLSPPHLKALLREIALPWTRKVAAPNVPR